MDHFAGLDRQACPLASLTMKQASVSSADRGRGKRHELRPQRPHLVLPFRVGGAFLLEQGRALRSPRGALMFFSCIKSVNIRCGRSCSGLKCACSSCPNSLGRSRCLAVSS
jgi:hypothetical protein